MMLENLMPLHHEKKSLAKYFPSSLWIAKDRMILHIKVVSQLENRVLQ